MEIVSIEADKWGKFPGFRAVEVVEKDKIEGQGNVEILLLVFICCCCTRSCCCCVANIFHLLT